LKQLALNMVMGSYKDAEEALADFRLNKRLTTAMEKLD